ncbi:MAG: hypothetical protein ABIO72_03405 [Patescibacteria group bacterium]
MEGLPEAGFILLCLVALAALRNKNFRAIPIPPRRNPPPLLTRPPVTLIVTMPLDLARAKRSKGLN